MFGGHDRTEKATPRKLTKERGKGQVAQATEFRSALVVFVFGLALKYGGVPWLSGIADHMRFSWTLSGVPQIDTNFAAMYARSWGTWFVATLAPVLLLALSLTVATTGATQGGFLVTTHPLKPNFGRLNPLKGVKKIFSQKTLFKLFVDSGKLVFLGVIVGIHVKGVLLLLQDSQWKDITSSLRILESELGTLVIQCGLLLLLFGLADLVFQRHSFGKDMMMTKREVKDEVKDAEGDPYVKARIRSEQKSLAKGRMMQDVPKADVVLTNPTHYAVALRYEAGEMGAPKVLAKGVDHVAFRIREIAEEHDVPIVENPELTRALFKVADIGQEIPMDLYKAVAGVLSFVYKKRGIQGMPGTTPAGAGGNG